jgi:hypothetical protein
MKNGVRRTTLTLPTKALAEAGRIARERKVKLSVVVSEALEKSLHAEAEAAREGERRVRAWNAYRDSVSDLSEEQRLWLDGIILSESGDE